MDIANLLQNTQSEQYTIPLDERIYVHTHYLT
jgi:hypothetical protein